ncbi:hypothetical protein PR048_006266 [Dryococelus australis]|uniref:HTH CENPB-type domain-containing protein n=1 Tax=Dryococelus australis TaxID=614101 RepID=A0ABQ9IAI6_9NEOP|nr:hypothetical protein PR048_006266 [Dryococelus australis]
MEQKVFNYVISMQELGFGLTVEQAKVIAFDVAEASGSEYFFNKQKRRASKKWWRNFKERYGLILRVPENIYVYRSSMANPVMIDDYLDKFSETTNKLKIQANLKDHIWNVDETGRMYVVKSNKVVVEIGKKFIYCRTYTEHEETMTLVGCISTNGTWIPPFIIFKGSSWNDAYKKDCLPNTQVHLYYQGWITKELFLMDSHGEHITPQVIELAKENDVHILTFPSHTTHILQPLDVGVYKTLKSVWQKTIIPKEKLVPSLLTERPVPEEVIPSDANPIPMTAKTNPGIQTPPSPVDNILKLPTAGPRKEPKRG